MFLRVADERLADLMLNFLKEAQAYGLSRHTVSAYRTDLALFYDFIVAKGGFPEYYAHSTERQWQAYLNAHSNRKTHASQTRAVRTVHAFLRFLVETKALDIRQVIFLAAEKRLHATEHHNPKHNPQRRPLLSYEDFSKVVLVLKKKALLGDEKAARDWLLVEFLGRCGLKASEAAALTWGQVGPTYLILRQIPLTEDTLQACQFLRYVRTRAHLSVEGDAFVFFGYKNISRLEHHEPIDRHGIKFVITEVTYEILNTVYRPEELRQHALRQWREQGTSLNQMQRWGGYRSLSSLKNMLKKILKS